MSTIAVLVTGFYSAAMLAGGAAMVVQDYRWHIPEGKVVAVGERTSIGYRYTMEDGTEPSFPGWVLRESRGDAPLLPGDRISKPENTFTYGLNGQNITGFGWVLRTHLVAAPKLILLCLFAAALVVRSLLPVFAWHPERHRSIPKALLILLGSPILWLFLSLFLFFCPESMAAVVLWLL